MQCLKHLLAIFWPECIDLILFIDHSYWTQGEVNEKHCKGKTMLQKLIIVLEFYVAFIAVLHILWKSR
jgi:hypothetical protein